MRRPDPLLVATIGLQWLATAGVAAVAGRTGAIYGDRARAEDAVAAAHSIVHGSVPSVHAGGYPLLLAPLVAVSDDVGSVASVVTTVQVVVLAPVAAYFLLEIAERAAGRLYAAAAALVWVLAPLAAVPLFTSAYRDTYVDRVLPAVYGLTVRPEFAAAVLSLAAAALVLRAVVGAPRAALVAGVLAGTAASMTPVAGSVALGLAVALATAGRWRALLEAAAGMAAALLPTLVWRQRALGGPTLTLGHPSWRAFSGTMAALREHFWSNRLLQWFPLAGAFGALRLSRPLAALLFGWFGATVVLSVATPSDVSSGSFFVSLIPAWPAFALLVGAIPALVPTLVRRLGSRVAARIGAGPVSMRVAVTALLLLAAVPLALAALIGR